MSPENAVGLAPASPVNEPQSSDELAGHVSPSNTPYPASPQATRRALQIIWSWCCTLVVTITGGLPR